MYAFSPTGFSIIGTDEYCPTVQCIVAGSYYRQENGRLTFEYTEEVKSYPDGQITRKTLGERLFQDEDGELWRESQLILSDEASLREEKHPKEYPPVLPKTLDKVFPKAFLDRFGDDHDLREMAVEYVSACRDRAVAEGRQEAAQDYARLLKTFN